VNVELGEIEGRYAATSGTVDRLVRLCRDGRLTLDEQIMLSVAIGDVEQLVAFREDREPRDLAKLAGFLAQEANA
jgi:hypothetical protein